MELETSEKLEQFRNQNPYTVPDNYFEMVDKEVRSRISSSKSGNVYQFRPLARKIAVAAIFVGVLLAIATILYTPRKVNVDSASMQMPNDSDLTIASKELIKSLNNTSVTIEESMTYVKAPHVSTKNIKVSEISDDEIIDYMAGNELEPLLVDL